MSNIEPKQIIIVGRAPGCRACKAIFDIQNHKIQGDHESLVRLMTQEGAAVSATVRGTKGEVDPAGAEHPVAAEILAELAAAAADLVDDDDQDDDSDDGEDDDQDDDSDDGEDDGEGDTSAVTGPSAA